MTPSEARKRLRDLESDESYSKHSDGLAPLADGYAAADAGAQAAAHEAVWALVSSGDAEERAYGERVWGAIPPPASFADRVADLYVKAPSERLAQLLAGHLGASLSEAAAERLMDYFLAHPGEQVKLAPAVLAAPGTTPEVLAAFEQLVRDANDVMTLYELYGAAGLGHEEQRFYAACRGKAPALLSELEDLLMTSAKQELRAAVGDFPRA
ncbi:MAG: hypothetical protein H6745_33235 [Deltaproteobacteria bacterium]|nr:hypothetical protein [Deltaproteobacteria bacterium]